MIFWYLSPFIWAGLFNFGRILISFSLLSAVFWCFCRCQPISPQLQLPLSLPNSPSRNLLAAFIQLWDLTKNQNALTASKMCHKSRRVQNKGGSPSQLNFQFATKAIVTFCKVQKQKQKKIWISSKAVLTFCKKKLPSCKTVQSRWEKKEGSMQMNWSKDT